MLSKKTYLAIFAISGFFLYSILMSSFFTPYWQTNDDVLLSMIAHGFGGIAHSDPRLIFSTVIWGHIAQALHNNYFDIAGYTLATYSVIVSSYIVITFCIFHFLKKNFFITVGLLLVSITPAVLSPQFTMTSASAAIACVFSGYTFVFSKQKKFLASAFLFGALSYCIRTESFFLICLLSLPIFPWRTILGNKSLIVLAIAFVCLILGLRTYNHMAYDSVEWQRFQNWERVRAAFSGYRITDEILASPQIYQEEGYSENDIRLMQNFFFADPKLCNSNSLQRMMERAKEHVSLNKLQDGLQGLLFFRENNKLKYFTLVALLAMFLFSTTRGYACLSLSAIVFFGISYAGHEPTFRVNGAAIMLFCLLPLLLSRGVINYFPIHRSNMQPDFLIWLNRAYAFLCMVGVVLLFVYAGKFLEKTTHENTERAFLFNQFSAFSEVLKKTDRLLVQGASYPIDYLFRPFDKFSSYGNFSFIWLASATPAPYSFKYNDESPEWFLNLMQHSEVSFIADSVFLDMISTWVQERLGKKLSIIEKNSFIIQYIKKGKKSSFTLYKLTTT